MKWELVLERLTQNRLNPDIARKHLRVIATAAERNKSYGFTARVGKWPEEPEVVGGEDGKEQYRYQVRLLMEKATEGPPDEARVQFGRVLEVVKRCASGHGWEVTGTGSVTAIAPAGGLRLTDDRPPFVVPPLTPDVQATHFAGVYERDEHIRLIHDAVAHHVDTLAAWRANGTAEVARSHTLLKGKPAAAKTTLLERFKAWFDETSPGAERMLFVDVPTMSKAGLENWLLERAELGTLPDILVLEEIEKQDPNNLLTLVSVMGSGYVSKMNAHIGHRKRLANVLVFATCNDEHVIRRFRNGALWSRFAHKLHCTRPGRELMGRILLDAVTKAGGDPVWVERALEFAYETMPTEVGYPLDDPREVKGLLDGRERLVDGTYQQDRLAVLKVEAEESRSDRRREQGQEEEGYPFRPSEK